MAEFTLKANKREVAQQSKLTSLKADSRVPGVIYGFGKESLPIDVDYKELLKILTEAGTSNIVVLKVGDKDIKTIVREYQQDPITDKLIHVDFMSVDDKRLVTTFVPLEIVGVSKAVREQGGKLNIKTAKVQVKCLPQYLPGVIEVDAGALKELGQKLTIGDLQVDENITILNNPLDPVVDVAVPKKIEIVEEIKPEGEEAKEGEEGEAKPGEDQGEATGDKDNKEQPVEEKK